MLNEACTSAMDHSWVPLSAVRRLHSLDSGQLAPPCMDVFAHIPVTSATVLALDMLLHEPCIDLRRAAELILSDVGATIQILRLIGREYDYTAQRLSRMGDCLASLDVGTWFGAISAARTFAGEQEHSATATVWKHCRLVAQYAQLVAESLEGVSPEDAYLVGLLHELDLIPVVLGWPHTQPSDHDPENLYRVEEPLPLFVLAVMRVVSDACPSSTWSFILTEAHKLAGGRANFDASIVPGSCVDPLEDRLENSHLGSFISH